MTVRIIGAGFSGLTVAYALIKQGVAVEIYEKSPRAGGLIQTLESGADLVETAANGILASPDVEELFQDLNLKKASRPKSGKARFVFRKTPRQWPLGVLETLSFVGGLIYTLLFKKLARSKKDETVEEWVKRLWGEAAYDYLVSPALQGVYGPVENLDAELLGRALKRSANGKQTVAPEKGMGQLIEALQNYIKARGGEFHFGVNGELRNDVPTVIATPAPIAALILAPEHPDAAKHLAKVVYKSLTTVTATFAESSAQGIQGAPLKGFGCLFPKNEGFNALGVLLNHHIFGGRSQMQSETWIFPNAVDDTDEIRQKLQSDRKRMLGYEQNPEALTATAWPHALPDYNKDLREMIDQIQLPPKIYLTGNYLGAIGLSKILNYNIQLAKKIREEFV